jgi:alpha-beta hydrolase superfamily lysophospholipase
MSGGADPVGGYGRGVEKVYRRLLDAHLGDVRMLIYPEARHEIFNELGREKIWSDLAAWLEEHNF